MIRYLNESATDIISIDLPSGLFADKLPESDQLIIHAKHTLSFQLPKYSFLFPSSYSYVGEWHILKIGLNRKYIDSLSCTANYITQKEVQSILKPREKFSHKGNYGHALLISGSEGKMGAAVMAASALLRSGAGLLTAQVPNCGVEIMQTAVPEAMVLPDKNERHISEEIEIDSYNAIGIGPGTGTSEDFKKVLGSIIGKASFPMVLDADALNVLSLNTELLKNLPANSILTPHIKEFERLSGKANSDSERHEMQKAFSKKYNVIVILKGAHTCISSPDGSVYFNSNGNSGMAKGGFGDVLTGIILGLLAQGYSPIESAQLGVFIHGMAGDIAKEKYTEYSMTAMELVGRIGKAFGKIMRGDISRE